MNLRNVLIVFRKEVRDMLRDKRTLRSMVIIPVVAFPLLFSLIGWAAEKFSSEAGQEASSVMIRGGDDSPKTSRSAPALPRNSDRPLPRRCAPAGFRQDHSRAGGNSRRLRRFGHCG